MHEPIPIQDNMPDKLKNAINYLNENNISLTDKINIDAVYEEDEGETDTFDGYISNEDLADTDLEDDDIYEEEVDLSDLNSMF